MKNKIFTDLDTATHLQDGNQHESIKRARIYLDRLGYTKQPVEETPHEEMSTYDTELNLAVSKFQQFFGLEVTGNLNEETRDVMELPRCGVADLIGDHDLDDKTHVSAYVASTGRWSSNILTYKFMNGTGDLPGVIERDIVRQAFDVWASVTPLTFTEVTGSADAIFLISWEIGDHGDGSPFDGPGHVLAHAFFPPPINPHPGIAGDMHFDDQETWATTHDGNGPGSIDLLSVAIHELGHALGLRHTNVPEAIMYPTYSGNRRTLAADDISGIQSIYGSKDSPKKVSWFKKLLEWLLERFS
jgi:peptidoglycan hydrolase-like protein with peptidoglycan-binding domain